MKASRFLLFAVTFTATLHATELSVPDGIRSDLFGVSASLSGNVGFIGAYGSDHGGFTDPGAAYIFRTVGAESSALVPVLKLTASDPGTFDYFGQTVSLSGSIGIVGVRAADISGRSDQGAAYVYRGLDTKTGVTTQDIKLTASDGAANHQFGSSVSIAGTIAVVGARQATGSMPYEGAAYIFRNLDTASGNRTQDAKLVSSDGFDGDMFGYSASLSGTTAIIGAPDGYVGVAGYQGAAYVYRNVDVRTNTSSESVKLTSSDGVAFDFFGRGVSMSGNSALVGAMGHDTRGISSSGAAYLYRNLDSKTGTITQDVKLTASDGAVNDGFGDFVSLSGNTAIVGVPEHAIGANGKQGAAYLFTNLGGKTGTINQTIKVTASTGLKDDRFGSSVSVDGDLFLIGAETGDGPVVNSGKGYAGTVSSMTTLDIGNATRLISGLSFTSQDNWIIGQFTDSNRVILSVGDTATVNAAGKMIAIGQMAGSDLNTLAVSGTLNATTIMIGAAGNSGNLLQLASNAILGTTSLVLAAGNSLSIQGNFTANNRLISYLADSTLSVTRNGITTRITNGNRNTHLTISFADGYTTFTAIPEPAGVFLASTAFFITAGLRRRLL